MTIDPAALGYDERGLLPVVVQEVGSGAVLMLAFADREAVEKTLETGLVHFWSRSRQSLWKKGETSGNTLRLAEITADCDGDALLVRAYPNGPTCHRGTRSCFEPNAAAFELGWLERVIAERRSAAPESSYTARLMSQGIERVAQKVGEEGVELALAAVSSVLRIGTEGEAARSESVVAEAADLAYHALVLLSACGVELRDVAAELARRHRPATPVQGGAS